MASSAGGKSIDTSVKVGDEETLAAEAAAKNLFDNPSELEGVLFAMTQPDNDSLRRATLTLASFLEEPRSITCLIQQLETSSKAEVRQVAAIYVRESIQSFWKKMPEEVQTKLKSFLLERLVADGSNAAERLAIAAAITATAKASMSKKEWPELLSKLGSGSAPDAPKPLREACLTIWRNLLQFCGGSLKKHFPRILDLIKIGLKEEESIKVQIESVKAIGAMVDHLRSQEEVNAVEECIPSMVQVIEKCMRRGEENAVVDGMEVFSDMIESSVPILNRHGLKLTEFMQKVVSTKDLPLPIRKQAVNFMTFMVRSKPKMVVKNKLVQPFLSLCIALILESDEMEDSFKKDAAAEAAASSAGSGSGSAEMDEEALDFISPMGIACDLLDEMYLQLPSENVFPLSVKAVEQLVKDKSEFKKRKAAFILIAMMAEGCQLFICKGENLKIMVRTCLNGFIDEAPPVRKSALEALAQLATHLNTEVMQHHERILDSLFEIFKRDEEDVRIKERALSTIEMFIDCYDDEISSVEFPIEKYLKPLMGVIGVCLKSKNKALQIQAVATLASTAACAKSKFEPYIDHVLDLLSKMIDIKDPELAELRAEATSCLGAVAQAAGKDRYAPHLESFHEKIMEGLNNLDSTHIRESTYMYFSDLSDLIKGDIADLKSFNLMVSNLITSMADDDGLVVTMPDDGFGASMPRGFLEAQEKIEEAFDNELDEEAGFEAMTEEELEEYIKKHQLTALDDADDDDDEDEDDFEEDEATFNAAMKNARLQVMTGFMQEKAAAIHALQRFICNAKFAMVEYLDELWDHLEYLWEYPHPVVKMALAALIHESLKLVVDHALSMAEKSEPSSVTEEDGVRRFNWTAGKTDYQFTPQLEDWLGHKVIPHYIQAIIDEHDKDALMAVLGNLNEILPIIGPKAVEQFMTELIKSIVLFYKEKTACFTNAQADDADVADVAGKHTFVTDSMAELCGVLAHIWGPSFLRAFKEIYPVLLRFAEPVRHPHDHAMCVGCIADVSSRFAVDSLCEDLMAPFAERAYQIALTVAQSSDENTKQNALYCLGALSMTAGSEVNAKYLTTTLRCIKGYTKIPREAPRESLLVRDNAFSALGKVLASQPDKVDFDELMAAFLGGLPMTTDYSENLWVYKVLAKFVGNDDSRAKLKGNLPRALQLMADAMPEENVPGPAKRAIAVALVAACQNESVRSLVDSALNDQQKGIVQRVVSEASG